MGKLDLSKFKKVRAGDKHTVLRHPEGHEITIFHKALSKPVKDQLDRLEMAEGGQVEENAALKENYQTSGYKQAKKRVNENMSNQMQHFSEGSGLVTKKLVVDAIRTAAGGQPIPSPTQAPPQYTPDEEAKRKATRESYGYAEGGQARPPTPSPVQTAQDSMRKAFHFAEGSGPVGEGDNGPLDPLEAQYGMENFNAKESVDNSTVGQIEKESRDAAAPITPSSQDMSHSHLSEALKNLSQKYGSSAPIQDSPASNSVAIGEQPTPPPQAPQSASMGGSPPSGNPQGTLPQQAIANVNQANAAEMSSAKNTQQSLNQEAQIHGDEAQKMQELHAKYEEIGNNLHKKFEDTAAQVEQGRIDPNHWWNSRSTGSQILTAIGMLASGAMTGASGHPEMASKAIDDAIDRDIDAQKANLNNKHTLLSKYMEMYNNLPQAEAAARLTMGAGVEGLIKQNAAKLGSANAVNAAVMANAQRRQALLPQMEGLAKGQVMGQMYGQMSQPQQASGSQEQAYQDQMQKMRILNPDLGKDMENKYLPNVGIARVPVTDALREKMAAQKDLSTKLAKLELFAQKNQGTTLDRETVNIGKTMAADAQQAARVAGHQGVYKESDQKFLEGMIDSDPTKFMASIRTIPKYKTLREQNDATLKTLYKSYGVKPFLDSNGSQSGEQPASASTSQTATMNGKQYRKVPGGWELVK